MATHLRPGGLAWLTSSTTKAGVEGSNLGTDISFREAHQLQRALYSASKHNSTRADEGRKSCLFFAIKMKIRTVVGRGSREEPA